MNEKVRDTTTKEVIKPHNFFNEVRNRWNHLTTSQRTYATALSYFVGIQSADFLTTELGLLNGFHEVGLTAPLINTFGPAAFIVAKIGGSALQIGLYESYRRLAGERYTFIPSISLIITGIMTTPAVISNIIQLINH